MRRSNQLSSEPSSRRCEPTLTASGPKPGMSVTGRQSSPAGASENPAFGPSDHCIGERTARRPGMSRFSPMPISSP